MGRNRDIAIGSAMLVGALLGGVAVANAVSIGNEVGVRVPVEGVVGTLAPEAPEPTTNPEVPTDEPVPVAPIPPQPIDGDDDDDDDGGDDDDNDGDD